VTPGETFVHGELYVGFTDPDGQKVFVPYTIVSGALAPLGQHCAHAAGRTCPCGASLSRWCPHCKQERTEFFAQSTKEGDSTKEEDSSDSSAEEASAAEEEDTSAEEDSLDSSAEEASAAGTDAEEDGDTETATLPEPLKDDVPPQGASATPPEPLENDQRSQGASASGGGSGNGVAASPSVSGHGGRELPPAGKKKKKKKKKKTPPQGEGVPAPPVPVASSAGPDEGEPDESVGVPAPPVPAASSAGPDEGEPDESVGATTGSDEREAAEVPPPYTCLTCGYDINGGGVVCLAPGCGGVAKGALQCRFCEMPLAPNANATCRQFSCHKRGGGFASPPGWDTDGNGSGRTFFSTTAKPLRPGGTHVPLAGAAHGTGLGSMPPLLGLSSIGR